jgi:hypothetical protein
VGETMAAHGFPEVCGMDGGTGGDGAEEGARGLEWDGRARMHRLRTGAIGLRTSPYGKRVA